MLARLQRSFDQQREFLGNAAHELKTPVAVLKSTLQSLLQRPRASEEYRAGLEQSLEDLERLEQLLQWMLRLARAEQWAHGALRRDLQIIDVTATCEEAIERVRHLAESRNATVRLSKNGAVPFRADPEDLQLVWINLLENAVRYGPEGGSVEVTVAGGASSPAQIVFEDHGAGIAACRSAPCFRALLPRRSVPHARHRRFWPWTRDRESSGRSLRRNHHCREHSRQGHTHDGRVAGQTEPKLIVSASASLNLPFRNIYSWLTALPHWLGARVRLPDEF